MAEQQEQALSTPLLLSTQKTHNEYTINIQEPHENPTSENPYEFLGIHGFSGSSSSSTADPFRNHTPRIDLFYEWFKIVVCIPIAVIRLVLFGLSLLVGYIATKIALQGWKDAHNPMPLCRSRLMFITRLSTRCILFSFGWISAVAAPPALQKLSEKCPGLHVYTGTIDEIVNEKGSLFLDLGRLVIVAMVLKRLFFHQD